MSQRQKWREVVPETTQVGKHRKEPDSKGSSVTLDCAIIDHCCSTAAYYSMKLTSTQCVGRMFSMNTVFWNEHRTIATMITTAVDIYSIFKDP